MATFNMPEQISPKFQRLLDDSQKLEGVRLADAIPKNLYKPRLMRGMLSFFTGYAVYIGALVAIAHAPHWLFYLPLWLLAGLGGWGLFCVAHDCGHHSFSRDRKLNAIIGHLSLIPLLYPFHGWRHMHNLHHSHTNSLELDTDWRPVTRLQYQRMSRWEKFVYGSTRSWLFWLGTVNYQRHSGFRPSMFAKMEARNEVRRSILFVAVVAAIGLPALIYFTGISGFFLYFLMPWLAIHAWFSLTTMMHHISDETPFLTKEHWTFNGSRLLLTTDYMYPRWLLFLTNYITVHTAHHVAPIIPHYNLMEAQAALKSAYPGMVREKPLSIKDVWRVARYCHLYDPVKGYYEPLDETPRDISDKVTVPVVDPAKEAPYTPAKPSLLRLYIGGLALFSNKAAGRKATDAFGYTRGMIKKRPKDVLPLGAKRFAIGGTTSVQHGYLWGKGEGTILLVHGWGANSSSMYSFAGALQKQGFKVAAFDAPAHGVSPGSVTTMTEFKDAVKAAITTLEDVVGIVAHSLGGIASTGALAELGREHRVRGVCLLGAPATLPAVIQRWSRQVLPMDPAVRHAMHAELWRRNGVPVEHWDIPQLGQKLSVPFLVLHDEADDVVPVCEAQHIARHLPEVTFQAVEGVGHVRILSDMGAIALVTDFLAALEPTGGPTRNIAAEVV
jgi:acyl-lipid omega-6 desaturase (Delta-12 desaturase)